MSTKTRQEILERLRRKYAQSRAGYRSTVIDQTVSLLGYHRKAAIRALNARKENRAPGVKTGRPKTYHRDTMMEVLKPIWFAAQQPCGIRLVAMLPEWLKAYEEDQKRIHPDVKKTLLSVSARTLDRLFEPLKCVNKRGRTRSGQMLKASIPIRGVWSEEGPGWTEMDTVSMCGGNNDDKHIWMLNVVDIRTDWTLMRAIANRGQHSTIEQLRDIEKSLPFEMLGADSDNGGEFINHHMAKYFLDRKKPVLFTRSRAYHKNDNAHVEQRNFTHVRNHFGYERYDNVEVVTPMINRLCKTALCDLHNHFLSSQKLKEKKRIGNKTRRYYAAAQTAYQRVMAAPEVDEKTKAALKKHHESLQPFALYREIEKQKKEIEANRLRKPRRR